MGCSLHHGLPNLSWHRIYKLCIYLHNLSAAISWITLNSMSKQRKTAAFVCMCVQALGVCAHTCILPHTKWLCDKLDISRMVSSRVLVSLGYFLGLVQLSILILNVWPLGSETHRPLAAMLRKIMQLGHKLILLILWKRVTEQCQRT